MSPHLAPSTDLFRFVEHIHGHLGWLAAAALVHPAIILKNPRRRARLAVVLSTLFVTLTGAIGAWLYPAYRELLKRALFVQSTRAGWMFERKEHLAVAAIAFAWIGMILHLNAREDAPAIARAAHRSYVASAIFAVIVAALGTYVAATKTF
jgi:hypothetical protein